MPNQPLFAGLVFDESGSPAETTFVGGEPCYVVNDLGFRRHIPSEQVDRQVLQTMAQQVKGNENEISEQTAKMLGQEDIFSKAIIQNQIKNIDQQLENLLNTGIPEEGRAYMGMMGFRITINVHGEVVNLEQPGRIADEGDE
jgi:hypothetical protein